MDVLNETGSGAQQRPDWASARPRCRNGRRAQPGAKASSVPSSCRRLLARAMGGGVMTVLLVIAKIVIVLALGAVAVLLGGRAVTRVFRLAERTRATGVARAERCTRKPWRRFTYAATYLRGGEWIGYLERLAVRALLAGFPEGIAVAMVVKSFARYPEIKASSTGAAERFIIGTFVSVLFASACRPWAAAWLISAVLSRLGWPLPGHQALAADLPPGGPSRTAAITTCGTWACIEVRALLGGGRASAGPVVPRRRAHRQPWPDEAARRHLPTTCSPLLSAPDVAEVVRLVLVTEHHVVPPH